MILGLRLKAKYLYNTALRPFDRLRDLRDLN